MYKLLNELANDLKIRTLGNFKKILEMSGIKDKSPSGHLKSKLWQLHHKIAKKTPDLKHFTEKPILLISRICLQYFFQDWRHFPYFSQSTIFYPQILKYKNYQLKYTQLKCKNYNVRLNAIIKSSKSQILVDYILYAYTTVKLFRGSNYWLKFLVLPNELYFMKFIWLLIVRTKLVNKCRLTAVCNRVNKNDVLQLLLIISYMNQSDSINKEARQQFQNNSKKSCFTPFI